MMSGSASTVHENGATGLALYEAAALATRTQALLTVLSSQLGAFADDRSATRQLEACELVQLGSMGDQIAELASRVALVLDRLPLAPLDVSEPEIANAAREALAEGIADQRRALMAARLLTPEQGFHALADALAGSDAHTAWPARVVDVLAAFRDVDTTRARQVAALAGVPETARFCELEPRRVVELAHTLRQLATRPRAAPIAGPRRTALSSSRRSRRRPGS
ncbi:MAG: hypothetical protein JWQ48_1975 [Conexibacter sp.]|nr:hypothetical protein [Conexibacter sp.]